MKLEITVCDVCKDPSRPIKSYTIGGGTPDEVIAEVVPMVLVERCVEHGVEFEALLKGDDVVVELKRPIHTQPHAPAGRSGRRPRVTSMADIEASKRR